MLRARVASVRSRSQACTTALLALQLPQRLRLLPTATLRSLCTVKRSQEACGGVQDGPLGPSGRRAWQGNETVEHHGSRGGRRISLHVTLNGGGQLAHDIQLRSCRLRQ